MQAAKICLVMSGGTEGGMAPHWTVFERAEGKAGHRSGPALAFGRAHTAALPPEHLGRLAQVDMVASAVRAAMADAGIDDAADVHFVQVKCPLLTVQRVGDAEARGAAVATKDTLKSMGLSRAASALGVAVALGEIERDRLTDGQIGSDWDVWSGRASCSAGVELLGHEVVVLGMSAKWGGPLAIDHAVMTDAIDIEPVRGALGRLGLMTDRSACPAPNASGCRPCSPKRRRATTAGCAAIATPCLTIPISHRPAMPAPSSAERWRHCSAMRRFMSPAAPSIRAPTAAGRLR